MEYFNASLLFGGGVKESKGGGRKRMRIKEKKRKEKKRKEKKRKEKKRKEKKRKKYELHVRVIKFRIFGFVREIIKDEMKEREEGTLVIIESVMHESVMRKVRKR